MGNEITRKYVGPELKIIRMNGNDIITTSGGEEVPQEGEFIPATYGGDRTV